MKKYATVKALDLFIYTLTLQAKSALNLSPKISPAGPPEQPKSDLEKSNSSQHGH